MAVMKSVQIMSESKKSFEVSRTSKSVNDVRSANINNMSVNVKDGKISNYRVNVNITFEVK